MAPLFDPYGCGGRLLGRAMQIPFGLNLLLMGLRTKSTIAVVGYTQCFFCKEVKPNIPKKSTYSKNNKVYKKGTLFMFHITRNEDDDGAFGGLKHKSHILSTAFYNLALLFPLL